jgi:hypothetical protein
MTYTTGKNSDGGNSLPVQAILLNERLASLDFFFSVALPYIFHDTNTMKVVAAVLMDEEWAVVDGARFAQIFSAGFINFLCIYHKVTQGLNNSENLGRGNFPEGQEKMFDRIKYCLMRVNDSYETEDEAQYVWPA